MLERIEAVLDECVRPLLGLHAGDLQVTKLVGNVVYVRLLGQCANCASAYYTLDSLIEKELKDHIPEVESVVLDSGDEALLALARKLLHHEAPPTEL